MGSIGSPGLYLGCWGAAGIRTGPCISLTWGQAHLERGNLVRGKKTPCPGSDPHTCPIARQMVVGSSTEVREKPQLHTQGSVGPGFPIPPQGFLVSAEAGPTTLAQFQMLSASV